MKTEITRNVIEDLLPVYLSGEVSADTRRIVEEYVQRDPEIQERLREAGSTLTLPATQPSPDLEKRALQATQNLLGRRFTLAIFAYTAAYSVFSVRGRRSEIVWLLYRDWPAVSYLLLAASAVLWICFFVSCRKLMVAGLMPAAKHSAWRWLAGGALASIPFTFVISVHTGWDLVRDMVLPAALVSLAIGHALGLRTAPPK